MKRTNPLAVAVTRTSTALAATLVLAFTTGCDQQGGQLTQLTESFQKKIDEKDKLLNEAQAAQRVAVAQKSELEGKLLALQSELDKAHANPGGGGSGPAISTEKLSAQVAAALDPMIRKAIQQAVASLPAPASGQSRPVVDNDPPPGRRPGLTPREELPPVVRRPNPPREDEKGGLTEVPPKNNRDRDPNNKQRPTGTPDNKIPIEFPPLGR